MPFHFLPGNYELNAARYRRQRSSRHQMVSYAGKSATTDGFDWRTVCRPHSYLAVDIVNNARIYNMNPELNLYLTGVTMHVFADTWVHQDFMGTPETRVNDAAKNTSYAFVPENSPWAFISGGWGRHSWGFTDSAPKWTLALGARNTSNVYLGHGRMGHLPDQSCVM